MDFIGGICKCKVNVIFLKMLVLFLFCLFFGYVNKIPAVFLCLLTLVGWYRGRFGFFISCEVMDESCNEVRAVQSTHLAVGFEYVFAFEYIYQAKV